jgi:hypothetical protein
MPSYYYICVLILVPYTSATYTGRQTLGPALTCEREVRLEEEGGGGGGG